MTIPILLLIPCFLVITFIKGLYKNSIEIKGNERNGNKFVETVNSAKQIPYPDPQVELRPDFQSNCDCLKREPINNELYDNHFDTTSYKPNTNFDKSREIKSKNAIIFVITPTYSRATQMADMTRLSQTLSLVRDIFWIVSEDSHIRSKKISELLNRTSIPSVHLLGRRPVNHWDHWSGRGVSNRLKALEYLRQTYGNTSQEGVLYFADDDNAYDIRIFEEMRNTRKVSVFPVGLIYGLGLSSPIVSNKTGKVIGFHDPYIGRRTYAIDMAGIADNLQLFLSQPKATMPYKKGYEEDYFIISLGIHLDDLEPKANNCTQILVWHTKTYSSISPNYKRIVKHNGYKDTNLALLYDSVLKNN